MNQVITSPYHETLSWFGFIAALAFIIIGVVDGLRAFIKGYRKKLPKAEDSIPSNSQNSEDWDSLCFHAKKVIEEIIAELPDEIRSEARQVPYLFKEHAENEHEGYRMLGSYHNFIPGRKSEYKGPIFLYLKTIEEICMENSEEFETSVKTTYLHELGHHFGWDEVDLVRHGLPSGRPPGG